MPDFHGLICAFQTAPALGALIARRTGASLPFGGRYRLIDFSLSALQNAGIHDVGVIMERDYHSLLAHLGSGKKWDFSRNRGGLRLLTPFGLPGTFGEYRGTMEALGAVQTYIQDIPQEHIVLLRGDLCANIDLQAAMEQHCQMDAEITCVCIDGKLQGLHHRCVPDGNHMLRELLLGVQDDGPGMASLEVYLMKKSVLLELIRWSVVRGKTHFHRDALRYFLTNGGRCGIYRHPGFAAQIQTTAAYYWANLQLLQREICDALFPAERPVRTREQADVSTYYSDTAKAVNCLVANGCYIEGRVENSILFRGVRVEKDAVVKNSILMQNSIVSRGAVLSCVIADKNVSLSPYLTLAGSVQLPLVVPKGTAL